MANLERQYTIPLRKEFLKVPRFRRAKKGVKAVREFIAKHMKTDIENVKVGRWLNEQVWARGMKSPPCRVTVKAIKDDKNIVKVELLVLNERAKKIEEKENKRRSVITEKKKKEEAQKKAEEEKAKKETEKQVADATKQLEEKVAKEKAKDAENKNMEYKKEEKTLEHEAHVHKEHSHAEHKPNMPHEKAQSKHPVRNVQER